VPAVARRDYYEVLGISRGASAPEVRSAYRRLARRYSPDVNVWDDRAAGLFEEIAEAYRVLGDPAARALYDRVGARALDPEGPEGRPAPARGEDVHCVMEIDFEDALRGVRAAVEVTRLDPCPACAGAGGAGGLRAAACDACGGRPLQVRAARGLAGRCAVCRGAGWRLPPPCPACGGRGTRAGPARIPVHLPPGVDTGSQIRVPGEGHAGPAPAGRGDLVVITRVRPHAIFTRKGDHLSCELPLTVPEAALGARVPIPTPDGTAVLTVPAGTQSGQVFRLRGRGCPRLDREGRGDLLVTAHVVIPRNADSTLESVLRTLERLWPEDPRAALWGRAGP
jgi:molecular chaperone DnaJ